jgi:hypothetical protein
MAAIFLALGLTGALLLISFMIAHAVYGAFLAPGAPVRIGAASFILLVLAHLLGRNSGIPVRLIVYYILAFGGLRIAMLPITLREFQKWAVIDYFLLVIGVSLFAGALAWGYSYSRRRTRKA